MQTIAPRKKRRKYEKGGNRQPGHAVGVYGLPLGGIGISEEQGC